MNTLSELPRGGEPFAGMRVLDARGIDSCVCVLLVLHNAQQQEAGTPFWLYIGFVHWVDGKREWGLASGRGYSSLDHAQLAYERRCEYLRLAVSGRE